MTEPLTDDRHAEYSRASINAWKANREAESARLAARITAMEGEHAAEVVRLRARVAELETQLLAAEPSRATHFEEAARLLEDTGSDGDAVNLLDNVADGIRAHAADTPIAAALLATPCDACQHTLNWHRNDVGCTIPRCVCGRFQP